METQTAPLIGGRYRIGGLLGEGGMARVFTAYDERLERHAAVKILRAETLALPGMRQRFQQEAFIAARLMHPHIVAVWDFGEDHSSSYLVMERLPGSTLRDEIVARGPLPAARVALVMSETLAALAAAHGRGVLHRDIKPSNILLQQDGHTKITDFGIAKSFDSRTDAFPLRDDMTMTGVVLGTPGYLAPERQAGFPATVQSDVYAVGAVMVEALTGQRLAPGTVPTDALPAALRDVACRALAVDPHQRFASANDMLQALGLGPGVRSDSGSPRAVTATIPVRTAGPAAATTPAPGTAHLAPPPVPRQRDTRTSTRRRRRLVLAAVGAVVLGSALFVLLDTDALSTGPTASTATHHVARPQTQTVTKQSPTTTPTTDAESSAITTLATSLVSGGYPGDGALASALQATAAQTPGADRQSLAQQTLSLAGVLLDGGGITSGQYQDVVTVLQPTGATVPATVTTPTPPQPLKSPLLGGHGHDHGGGDGQG